MSEVPILYVSWPNKAPTTNALGNIRQIRYFINVTSPPRKGFVDVWSINIFSPKDKPLEGHWRWFPAAYTDHLKRIFYRFNVYFRVLDDFNWGKRPQELNALKIYIGYLDKVLDAIWDEVRVAAENNTLNSTWRSTIFDKWLQIECLIGRHDADSLDAYKKAGKLFQDDPMELGKCLLNIFNRYFLNYRYITYLDWTSYESETYEWHNGTIWNYDANAIPKSDIEDIGEAMFRWMLKRDVSKDDKGVFLYMFIIFVDTRDVLIRRTSFW